MNSTPAPLKKDEEILSSKYEMKINDEKYLLHLISNSLELNIKIEKKNSISSCFYQNSFNSEQLKKLSKSFTFYDSIKDIYFCIKTILDRGNGKLIKENENIIFSIPIFLPTGNQEIIKFNMKKQQLEKDEIIQGLYSRINDLENIIVTLKENEKNKDILINNIKKRLDILEEKAALSNGKIVIQGKQPYDLANNVIRSSDILLSIGNNESPMMPSKIYEYVSTGKPIIHFYTWDSDPCIAVLEKYGNALLIDSRKDIDVRLLEDFVKNSKLIPFDKVESIFLLSVPEFTISVIEKE